MDAAERDIALMSAIGEVLAAPLIAFANADERVGEIALPKALSPAQRHAVHCFCEGCALASASTGDRRRARTSAARVRTSARGPERGLGRATGSAFSTTTGADVPCTDCTGPPSSFPDPDPYPLYF